MSNPILRSRAGATLRGGRMVPASSFGRLELDSTGLHYTRGRFDAWLTGFPRRITHDAEQPVIVKAPLGIGCEIVLRSGDLRAKARPMFMHRAARKWIEALDEAGFTIERRRW